MVTAMVMVVLAVIAGVVIDVERLRGEHTDRLLHKQTDTPTSSWTTSTQILKLITGTD
jgi:hypothetical protein